MKNEVRRGVSIVAALVFAFFSYSILVLFIDGALLWALVLGVLVYSVVAIDKSILEGDNRRMLNEKLTVEVEGIEKKGCRRKVFKDEKAEVLDKKAEVLDKKAEVMKMKAEVMKEEAEVREEEKVVRKEEEMVKRKVAKGKK